MIRIKCPKCDKALGVDDSKAGSVGVCPGCGAKFRVPVPKSSKPEAGSEEISAGKPAAVQRPWAEPDDDDEDKGYAIQKEPEPPPPPKKRPRVKEDEEADYEEVEEEEEVRPRRRKRRRSVSWEYARSAVAGPAIALMITGGLAAGLSVAGLVLNLMGFALVEIIGQQKGEVRPNQPNTPDEAQLMAQRVGGIVGGIVGICWGLAVFSGALKMKNLESRGYAMASSIIAMVPCNLCCLLGLPFGIWALVVLNKPDVRSAFG